MAWFFKYDDIPERHDAAMPDGSVQFLSDPSGCRLGLFQIDPATDQPAESKTLGEPVTFTATIYNPPGFAGGVFVASADLDGSVRDGTSNTLMLGEGPVDTRVPIVGDWNGDGRDAVGHDNNYAGSHVLYQDLVVPVSNLDPYVLTSVDHHVTDSSIGPELDDQALLMFTHGDAQAGCSPFLCGDNSPLLVESQATHVAISPGDASAVEATSLWPHDLLLL
jgi:hypothetical protein